MRCVLSALLKPGKTAVERSRSFIRVPLPGPSSARCSKARYKAIIVHDTQERNCTGGDYLYEVRAEGCAEVWEDRSRAQQVLHQCACARLNLAACWQQPYHCSIGSDDADVQVWAHLYEVRAEGLR